jgi:hypothetical protein
MGQADVGIITSIYTHLYGREEAERAFREAMSSRAVIGKSLAGRDHDQPGLAGVRRGQPSPPRTNP